MSTTGMTDNEIIAQIETTGARLKGVRDAARSVIFGQETVIDRTLITLLAGGHGLLIGVPGLAKTLLVETLGTVLGVDAKRIQFTPEQKERKIKK
jgi:MoxR-like ATPase